MHQKLIHENTSAYKCNFCGMNFNAKQGLEIHEKTVHEKMSMNFGYGISALGTKV